MTGLFHKLECDTAVIDDRRTTARFRGIKVEFRSPTPNANLDHASSVDSLLAKLESAVFRIDLNSLAFADFAFEDVDRERVENFFLDRAPERARAVDGIVAF